MSKKNAPRYGVSYGWALGEGPWNADMDVNLKLLDVIIGGSVIDDALTTPPSGITSTFDPTKTAAAIALSNGDLTATATSGANNFATAFTTVGRSTGKYYFESTLQSTYNSFDIGIGVGLNTQSLANYVGQVTKSIGYVPYNGQVNSNFTTIGTIGTNPGGGDVIGMAVDCDAGHVWFSINGVWQNSGNPATGANPFAITGWAAGDKLYPGATLSTTGRKVTFNLGASAFGSAVPSGFSAWAGSGTVNPGDCYIVGAGATGAWAGKDDQVAAYIDAAWMFIAPKRGLIMDVQSANALKKYDGTAWQLVTTGSSSASVYPEDQGGFIDGNFDSWQLGTSYTLAAATDTYTADMWINNAGTGGAATVSAESWQYSTSMAPRRYRMSHAQTTAATTSPTIGQKLEGVGQYNGQSITVSGLFAADVAATDIVGVQATQFFGTGGSPSSTVVTSKALTWALGTTEASYSVRLDIPSIAGKTIGTTGDDFFRIDFLLATGATYTVHASQLQIDLCDSSASGDTTGTGGSPKPFRWRGLSIELARVAWHINVVSAIMWGMSQAFSTTQAFGAVYYSKMRASPAISPNAVGNFCLTTAAAGTSNTCTGLSFSNIFDTSAEFFATIGSGALVAGNASCLFQAASAPTPKLILDARL